MPSAAPPHWNHTCIEALPDEERLEHIRYCSPFAAALIDRHPEWFEQLEANGRLDEPSSPDENRAREWVETYGLDDGLRAFRNQEMLRIVWRDLNGLAALGEVLADLTALAEICLSEALNAHQAKLHEKHGGPRDAEGAPQVPVVIGLGKLGGGELNLSSDIDVLFCYPTAGRCDGPRALSNEEYFAKLAQAVISTLGEARPTGFCFRVDTRLRPFGQAGPIACSIAAMEQYYQREGRNWERYALVKARPVGGDRAAGEGLLEALRPFVYRRYIDFGAIEALREMQALIRAQTARRNLRHDIKLGPGGIREVEFLAQGFQLLRGGREPRLQTPRLAAALEAIEELGLMPAEAVATLRGDYTWMRHVENRLQAMRDQQTHRIPEGEDFERLRTGLGFTRAADFRERLAEVQERVSDIFDRTWAGHGGQDPEKGSGEQSLDRWQRQWAEWREQPTESGPESRPESGSASGSGPDSPIRSFLSSLARRPAGQLAAKRLDRFMPMLLQRIGRHNLSDEAVSRLLDLVLVITQRSAYLALLTENPEALDRTVELFASSRWVADRVARFPELLDELIDPALGRHIPDREALQRAVARKREQKDEEAVLAGLNYLKQASGLRLAVAWLEDRIDQAGLQESLTSLAEVMVTATMQIAQAQLERRHGLIEGAGVAVIGYGSLGARELGFDSDLDLVFLYREGKGESAGKRPLAAERWFARLAQRMVALLTALTPSGRLYEIDARLRPGGRSGLLVSGIEAFEAYQRKEAWTWEAQALTRARAVAGDDALRSEFEDIRLACLRRRRDPNTLGGELADMRERIRKTHGDGKSPGLAIKHGPGGLVDIGFIAQLGVLALAAEKPEVAHPTGAAKQLEALREAGWLDEVRHRLLQSRLKYLRESRMRIELRAMPADRAAQEDDGNGEAVSDLFREMAGG